MTGGQKHPHGRGEDLDGDPAELLKTETPPRAWGRPVVDELFGARVGNTPTGVGKTLRRY